jgi:hypothetical protein
LLTRFKFCLLRKFGGAFRDNGFYDQIQDRDRYYTKSATNPSENDPDGIELATRTGDESPAYENLIGNSENSLLERSYWNSQYDNTYAGLSSRPIRPRFLCFLKDGNADYGGPESSFDVRSAFDNNTEYVFISYTRLQFCVEARENEENEVLMAWKERDRKTLLRFGIEAAKAAGVPAFWIDFECIAMNSAFESGDDFCEDVYNICDIVRGAHSMIVVVGADYRTKDLAHRPEQYQSWLIEWGSRMWVLPELLLSPMEHRVRVYVEDPTINPESVTPDLVAKRNLVGQACLDAEDVRQLSEHYEGSIQLSKLELMRLAVDCLSRRRTEMRTKADLAYALNGLVGRRPRSKKDESGFEAFASLSLANDSQRLLERLICVLPVDPNAEWHDMRDGWRMKLWDIQPLCQVAGIINDRTVLLDGAYGASIRWDQLQSVPFIKRETYLRQLLKTLVLCTPLYIFIGLFGALFLRWRSGMQIYCLVLLGFGILFLGLSPLLFWKLYTGKFWNTQAWFFGIEGEIQLGDIEKKLFGFNGGRLKWSPCGSIISNHHCNEYNEREADPPDCKDIRDIAKKFLARHRPVDEEAGLSTNSPLQRNTPTDTTDNSQNTETEMQQRRFTLIDTYTMTATAFYAYNPPTAVFICGQEGGMQRAVLCSYDHQRHIYCRETVLRMKTIILERMHRVDRFAFSLKRAYSKIVGSAVSSDSGSAGN